MTFYTDFFTGIKSSILDVLNGKVQEVMTTFDPIFTSMLIIYIVWFGYEILFGTKETPIKEAFIRIFKIGMIVTVGLKVGVYNTLIVDTLIGGAGKTNIPDFISAIFTGANSINTLDTVLNEGANISMQLWDKISFSNISYLFLSLIIYAVVAIVTLYGAFLLLLAQIYIAILVAIGPIFIVLYLFASTKMFFEKWLNALINYTLLTILVNIIFALFLGVYKKFLGDVNNLPGLEGTMNLFIFSIIFFLILRQVPELAGSLSGGASLSDMGAGKALSGKATGGAKSGAGSIMSSIGNYGKRQLSKSMPIDFSKLSSK